MRAAAAGVASVTQRVAHNVLNPSRIVLGGGLLGLGPLLLAEIKSSALQASTPLATAHLSIVQSALGDRAGVIGAAWLASETLLDNLAGTSETSVQQSA